MMNRRQLLGALGASVVGVGAAKAIPIDKSQQYLKEICDKYRAKFDSEALADLKLMCGVQDVSTFPGLVFALQSKYRRPVVDVPDALFDETPSEMAFIIDKFPVAEPKGKASLCGWRVLTAQTLLRWSKTHFMGDPRVYCDDETRFHKDYEHTAHNAPFIMQRRRNYIARITRRGGGNTLVGCEQGLAALQLSDERGQSYLENNVIGKDRRIVTFKTGEVCREPFALIGYNGRSKYDSGLLLGLGPNGEGTFVNNNTKAYWTRLI